MIRRINKLKNVGRFADLRSKGGSQQEFAKLNVIYAPNGSGKTTLCDVFRSLGSKKPEFLTGRKRFGSSSAIEIEILLQGSPAPKATFTNNKWQLHPEDCPLQRTMVYDDRFVADNVLVGQSIAVEQRRNLYGLALGTQGQALKAEVDSADRELAAATTALNTAKAALSAHLPTGYTIETFRSLKKVEDVDRRVEEAIAELEGLKRTKKNAETIRQHRPLQVEEPPSLPEGLAAALATTLNTASLKAESYIRQHLERNAKGLSLDWVGQGHKAQAGTACPHCGQDMQGLQILAAYRDFFSGALQEQANDQARILREAEERFGPLAQQRFEQLLATHQSESDWWKDAGGLVLDLPTEVDPLLLKQAMEATRLTLLTAIHRKQAHPTESLVLSDQESHAFAQWDSVSGFLEKYMATISGLNASIVAHQRAAEITSSVPVEKRLAELKLSKKRYEAPVVEAYTSFDKATVTKATREKVKAAANKALKDQSEQVLNDYGERINALLRQFNVGFRLISGGVNFLGGPPAGELAVEILGTRVSTSPDDAKNPSRPSLANTLSGGDRSALGLAFFVAVAERDAHIDDSVLVFDDPFHSQDRSRRRRTIECVHRMASLSKQCFVLSHELDFAREAAQLHGIPTNTFTLDALHDHSVLEAKALPPLPARAYEQDYAKLIAFRKNPAEFSDQLKDVARCIRQCLEGYMRMKFPKSWEPNEWLGEMIGKLRDAPPSDVLHHARHLVDPLTQVNNWGKRYYHAETDGSEAGAVDSTELESYVDQTLRIISG
jgi:wobble nucleotide-excising tRNase